MANCATVLLCHCATLCHTAAFAGQQPGKREPATGEPLEVGGLTGASAGAGAAAEGAEGQRKGVKFEARIVDVFHFGYCLRATVDGVPLEGLLISYSPQFAKASRARMSQ